MKLAQESADYRVDSNTDPEKIGVLVRVFRNRRKGLVPFHYSTSSGRLDVPCKNKFLSLL